MYDGLIRNSHSKAGDDFQFLFSKGRNFEHCYYSKQENSLNWPWKAKSKKVILIISDLCTSNPCLHQGTYTVLPDGLRTNCTCVEGFSGGFCEIVYNSKSVYFGRVQDFSNGMKRAALLGTSVYYFNQNFQKTVWNWKRLDLDQWLIQDFPERGTNSGGGTSLLFGQFVPKTAWKWRNFGPGGVGPSRPRRSANGDWWGEGSSLVSPWIHLSYPFH